MSAAADPLDDEGTDAAAEARIGQVWRDNALAWQRAVREERIESRRLVTDQAILGAIMAQAPRRVIDLGCGEGWLCRALSAQGIAVLGVDAQPALIAAAQASGEGRYRCLTYADIAAGALVERTDVVVCNFSLLGDRSVTALLRALPALLVPGCRLIVQTLHPLNGADGGYRNGWREGNWQGCGEGFGQAAPWYFRTLAGWFSLFSSRRLHVLDVHEPSYPDRDRPASIMFLAQLADDDLAN